MRLYTHCDDEEKYPENRAHRERTALESPRADRANEPFRAQTQRAKAPVGAAGAARYSRRDLSESFEKQIRWHHGERPSS